MAAAAAAAAETAPPPAHSVFHGRLADNVPRRPEPPPLAATASQEAICVQLSTCQPRVVYDEGTWHTDALRGGSAGPGWLRRGREARRQAAENRRGLEKALCRDVFTLYGVTEGGLSVQLHVHGHEPTMLVRLTPPEDMRLREDQDAQRAIRLGPGDTELLRDSLHHALERELQQQAAQRAGAGPGDEALLESELRQRGARGLVTHCSHERLSDLGGYSQQRHSVFRLTLRCSRHLRTAARLLRKGIFLRRPRQPAAPGAPGAPAAAAAAAAPPPKSQRAFFITMESDTGTMLKFKTDSGVRGCSWLRVPSGRWLPLTAENTAAEPEDRYGTCTVEAHTHVRFLEPLSASVDPRWGLVAPARFLYYDIECAGRPKIFPVPQHDSVIQIGYCLLQADQPLETAICGVLCWRRVAPLQRGAASWYDSEEALLDAFGELVQRYDPDVLAGFNTNGFDTPYLIDRADRLNALHADGGAMQDPYGAGSAAQELDQFAEVPPYDYQRPGARERAAVKLPWLLSRVRGHRCTLYEQSFNSGARGHTKTRRCRMPGRVQFDLLEIFQIDERLRSYTLNSISQLVLGGDTKADMDYEQITPWWNTEGAEGDRLRGLIADYCAKDSWLPAALDRRRAKWTNYQQMAQITGVDPEQLWEGGQTAKVMQMLAPRAQRGGFFFPDRKKHDADHESYDGGYVGRPQVGFYEQPVATLDFSGLYPNTQVARNICPSTLLPGGPRGAVARACHLRPGVDTRTNCVGHTFVRHHVRLGLLPHMLREILAERSRVKKQMKSEGDPTRRDVLDSRQLALKLSANSVYGFMGNPLGRLYAEAVAHSVTASGREMIRDCETVVEDHFCLGQRSPTLLQLEALLRWARASCRRRRARDAVSYHEHLRACGAEAETPLSEKDRFDAAAHVDDAPPGPALLRNGGLYGEAMEERVRHRTLWRNYLRGQRDDPEYLRLNPTHEKHMNEHELRGLRALCRGAGPQGSDAPLPGPEPPALTASALPALGETGAPEPDRAEQQRWLAARIAVKKRIKEALLDTAPPGELDAAREAEAELLRTEPPFYYEANARVIYGDTDSIMVLWEVDDLALAHLYGEKAEMLLNLYYADAAPTEMEYEKTYMPYLLLKKKRYAGLLFKPWAPLGSGKRDQKGVAAIRRNYTLLTKRVQQRVIDMILSQEPLEELERYCEEQIVELLHGRVDVRELIKGAQYTKPADQYKVKQAHVELVRRMEARDPASAPKLGQRVAYVRVQAAKGAKAYEAVEDPMYALRNEVPLDRHWYLQQELRLPLERVLHPVMGEPRTRRLFEGKHTKYVEKRTSRTGPLAAFIRKKRCCRYCRAPLIYENDNGDRQAICRGGRCVQRAHRTLQRDEAETAAKEAASAEQWERCRVCCAQTFVDPELCVASDCTYYYRRNQLRAAAQEARQRTQGTVADLGQPPAAPATQDLEDLAGLPDGARVRVRVPVRRRRRRCPKRSAADADGAEDGAEPAAKRPRFVPPPADTKITAFFKPPPPPP